jgi:hypothetical protein
MSTGTLLKEGILEQVSPADASRIARVNESVHKLETWLRSEDYAGYEPFDLMNSPYIGKWARRFPFYVMIRQYGRRFAGSNIRRILRVPISKNCKALGLILSGYCELSRCGENWRERANYLKAELRRLRSPGESEFCWGYDWDAISFRAENAMPAFSPNAVTTFFCAEALLDMAELFKDQEALEMAQSAGRFFVTRLNRSVDSQDELCFSYTPGDQTRIYNSTALVSAFLTRLAAKTGVEEYLSLARRSLQYVVNQQLPEGGWYYGATRRQKWIDSFHTAYNLDCLLEYRRRTGDTAFDDAIGRGYSYYERTFFRQSGPSYYNDRSFPIDIHCCSQAILTFCNFGAEYKAARTRAIEVAAWTLDNMRASDGTFVYQRHRLWTNRTPYMRWSQGWMFKALARLRREMLTSAFSN